ncbi:hypothetical protein OIDMADRAFT_174728 [Oidiodendron maius Zn]|uniref:Autophagy-related protein 29 n=1 Tax=Oidiodendron maius (strain Zn) TaxID=913774 RepID=A0A0C3I043_OIDMZ|nr:hypothetical protein OIDMADRAFT_174728 [Oidiodendron maius Zn]
MSADPSYTVLVRLPFPRGDFVDPPPVEWDATKDKALWKILSKPPKTSDINWNDLATKFNVSLPFLLQQAAWLYENQLLQVREQIMKVGVSKPLSASPVPGATAELSGGDMMKRTGSGGGRKQENARHIGAIPDKANPVGPRPPSSLSIRRDSPIPKELYPGIAGRTAMHSPLSSVAIPQQQSPNTRTPSQMDMQQTQRASVQSSPPSSPSSNSGSSASPSPAIPTRFSRRPPQFAPHRDKRNLSDDDDEDDDEPAFMPLANNDPSATLRDDPKSATRKSTRGKGDISQTSDSSTSSMNPVITRETTGQRRSTPGPLSPKRTAELSGRKESSDGTPSMGSSFSDLDDASVTQSALEEALASNMRAGGMASRMSSISQALRSRYL